jgi:predicted DCC family thiol-disulfide oxidoreductase YuxK
MTTINDIWFVYDGECPIWKRVSSFYEVRQEIGRLHTINAREQKEHPIMLEINQAGLNLDEGMIIKYGDRLYQGDSALHIIGLLGADIGFLNRINNRLFRHKKCAIFCYPVMKAIRNIFLKLKGVQKIENLKSFNE